ncbi:hypothetical protein NEUTE1DRAFT_147517 [Neurospora tetrasperma FGSC 2508]|uniref:Uncharacterized protein n=1 Tax=Neurospora tetrasperma (strain FGSC 2508 / ATCC MYA-4615 / P0657) TaxID=510951 RepID=F8MNX8_NEUT8|nr:uncharacterized protein NEUTE1DRAFT_147517 [Neurospora tetrasperma FGSC 2508]EGO57043.1 hypothetical protein NEUTE1DRAFT_147517 [Neurospora tetrasperma FGSC 2508]EGZ70048.1 hypothetical protein NEUTE2DRAFT_158593 [Neurospora tetrasperma FGSC 2509]
MASNSELAEIKLLLHSLASDIKAVKADVAELKKSQVQSQQSTPTCAKRTDGGSKLPNIEKALSDTETKLADHIRDTQSAILQLVEEEKVLIQAEVVQLSRTVGTALENAKEKMMEMVAEVVDENNRKRSRSTAGLDEDDDDDDESDMDEDNPDDYDSWTKRRRVSSALDKTVMDIIGIAEETFDNGGVALEWLLGALISFHNRANGGRIRRWYVFQKEGEIGFGYCLYGLFYHGHEHEGVAEGLCFCRERHPPGLRQRATRCIRVRRSEDGSGKLQFSWGADIGPAPVLGRYE